MNLSKIKEWRTEEPGVLQCMWLQRVGHDSTTKQRYAVANCVYTHTYTYVEKISKGNSQAF